MHFDRIEHNFEPLIFESLKSLFFFFYADYLIPT